LELSQPQNDGHSLREHLEVAARQNDSIAEKLIGPDLPELFADLWEGFIELDRARGHGPSPLSYSDIESWARLTGRRLSTLELALLIELDRLWFVVRAEVKGKK